jgi:6-phosphogluconolactonase
VISATLHSAARRHIESTRHAAQVPVSGEENAQTVPSGATQGRQAALEASMLETFTSSADLAEAAADAVAARLNQGQDERGRATLVATGGRSPGEVYDRLTMADLPWTRVVVTLSDERCVAPDAPASNARLLHERLLRGRAKGAAFVPLWRGAGTPEEAALDLEPQLRAMAPFDAVLLGMGEDGHVASLIPGNPIQAAAMDPAGERLAMGFPAGWGAPPLARITLTLSALLRAREILILIAGEAKRQVLDAALGGADLPIRAVLAQGRTPVRVLWAPQHSQ